MNLRPRLDAADLEFEAPAAAFARWNPALAPAMAEEPDTINILDPIGQGLFFEGVTAKRIDGALRRIGSGRDVVVNINSPGGDMFEAFTILNMLREHRGNVEVRVLGSAASAASIIAMAGDDIVMKPGAMMFIHNPLVAAAGDYQIFAAVLGDLRKFTDAAVGIYEGRTGLDAKTIRKMLDAETWMSARDALDKGFATRVEEIATTERATAGGDGSRRVSTALEAVRAALAGAGLTRTERRSILDNLVDVPAPGTGEDAAPGTGDFAKALQNLNATLRE